MLKNFFGGRGGTFTAAKFTTADGATILISGTGDTFTAAKFTTARNSIDDTIFPRRAITHA